MAHNAQFDRGFVEPMFPAARGKQWLCSMSGIDWAGKGFPSKGLQNLLSAHQIAAGRAHRAGDDVKAALELLARADAKGAPYFGELIAAAPPPAVRESPEPPAEDRDTAHYAVAWAVEPLPEGREAFGAAAFDLLGLAPDFSLRPVKRRGLNFSAVLASLMVLALLFMGAYIPFTVHQNDIMRLEEVRERLGEIKGKVRGVEKLKGEVQNLETVINLVNEERVSYVPRLRVLNELARVLPADAWVRRMAFVEDKVSLEGEAASAMELPRLLEGSPVLRGAKLEGQITISASERENYKLECDVAAPSGAPANDRN